MKRILAYSFIFILFFSVSLLSHLPISFVLQHAPKVRGLSIEGAQGTVWQGSASNIKWQRQNYGQVNWDFQFSALFAGSAEYAVRFGRGSDLQVRGKGLVGYSLVQGPYVENLVASVPVEEVMKFSPMPLPVEAQGQVEVNIAHAVYAQPWCQSGTGNIVWNAQTLGTPMGDLELGPIIADLSCTDSTIAVKGEQKSSNVSAEFNVDLTPDRRYKASAWFKPGAEFPEGLKSQLRWLGNPNNQGQFKFSNQGRI